MNYMWRMAILQFAGGFINFIRGKENAVRAINQ